MKILVVGSGGREHALAWKLRESQQMDEIYCAPGNAGIGQEAECRAVNASDPCEVLELARSLAIDLTVVGPEAPLVAGIADEFEKAGLFIVGPTKAAARLEGSKVFAKEFMRRHNIPTANFAVADTFDRAVKLLAGFRYPVVVKADGLAAGKGVVIARNRKEAERALDEFMRQKALGDAGERVVLEECLKGEELSFIVLTDGRRALPLAPTQDHKRAFDNDEGPNTGGMGAFSDDVILPERLRDEIVRSIVIPTLGGMAAEGAPFKGFLYCGLMLTAEGPQLLEYNARLGDPEAQAIMMRLRSDLVDLLVGMREGQLGALDAHWTPNPAVCVVLASKGYPGAPEVGKAISGCDACESAAGVKIFHAGTRVENHQLVTAGGRVLGVTAAAENLPAAIERAYGAVKKISFDGMHYRKDIGAKGLQHIPIEPRKSNPIHPRGGRISGSLSLS